MLPLIPNNFPLNDVVIGAVQIIENLSAYGDRSILVEHMEQYGFDREFHSGCEKFVFVHPAGFVMKIPRCGTYMSDVRREAATIQALTHINPAYFPRTASMDCILIQEITLPNEELYLDHEIEIHDMASELGIDDIHPYNVGWRPDGSFTFIDCGAMRDSFALDVVDAAL